MKYKIVGSSLQDNDTRLFLQSLIPYLRGHGHRLVDIGEDVVISFGHSSNQEKPTVLRWDETCDKNSLNPNVSAVVFSSNHDLNLTKLNYKNSHIVCSGIDVEYRAHDAPTGFQSIRRDYEIMITLPIIENRNISESLIKEIYENIKLFSGKKCCLVIMSNDTYRVSGNDIFYVPWLDSSDRNCIFSMSNFVLYLDRKRSEPHELLEALTQGTRVINLGQNEITHIVGAHGIPSSLVNKPQQEYPWDLQHIDIRNVSKKYSDIISSLL